MADPKQPDPNLPLETPVPAPEDAPASEWALPGMTRAGSSAFPVTRWTLVAAAGNAVESQCQAALSELCESYWYPVYAFLRRSGRTVETSQDLTQEFFLRLMQGEFFARANPAKGAFRSFLMTALRRFLADESDHRLALKRGGGAPHLPFDPVEGESRYAREPRTPETPERVFERRWALTLLDRVVRQIEAGFVRGGRLDLFQHLKPFLAGNGEVPYADLARTLDISESALKSGIHRLRKRYRDTLRAEVAATVADPAEVDAELRYLIQALSADPASPRR